MILDKKLEPWLETNTEFVDHLAIIFNVSARSAFRYNVRLFGGHQSFHNISALKGQILTCTELADYTFSVHDSTTEWFP